MDRSLSQSNERALDVMAAAPPFQPPVRWNGPGDALVGNWTFMVVGSDRQRCVAAAVAAVRIVAPRLPPDAYDAATTRDSVNARIVVAERWLQAPSVRNQELALSSFDHTRQTHAWSDFDFSDAWTNEAADFALHAVWSGALRGPFEPVPPAVCAVLAAVCAARSLALEGISLRDSSLTIARAIEARLF